MRPALRSCPRIVIPRAPSSVASTTTTTTMSMARRCLAIVRPVAQGSTPRGIGFIGSGSIAQMHNRALKVLPSGRANLIAVYDKDTATAESSAEEFGCQAASSVDDILNNPAIDSVYILTHLDSHVPLAIKVGISFLTIGNEGLTP
jgi:hypothetical protein